LLPSLLALVVLWTLFPPLRDRFHAEIDKESSRSSDGLYELSPATRKSAAIALTMLVTAGIAALFTLLAVTLALAMNRHYVEESGTFPHTGMLIVVGVSLSLAAAVLWWSKLRTPHKTLFRHLAFLVVLPWPIILFVTGSYSLPIGALLPVVA